MVADGESERVRERDRLVDGVRLVSVGVDVVDMVCDHVHEGVVLPSLWELEVVPVSSAEAECDVVIDNVRRFVNDASVAVMLREAEWVVDDGTETVAEDVRDQLVEAVHDVVSTERDAMTDCVTVHDGGSADIVRLLVMTSVCDSRDRDTEETDAEYDGHHMPAVGQYCGPWHFNGAALFGGQ